ncbi:MAG: UDP-N-acetylmuramate dehydrogenase [Gemmatimonadota bacterium]
MRLKHELEAYLGPGRIREAVPLAPLTTFRIGGPADLFFAAGTAQELVLILSLAREWEIPTFLLGRGANILVSDAGYRGLVVKSDVGGIEFLDHHRVRAGSGVQVFPDLIRATVDRGLGGLHHFVGIPSTVGGAIWQNLHFLSPGRDRTLFIEESVESAEIFSEEGREAEVSREYFRFGYDYSILHDRNDVVLSATFRLEPESIPVMKEVMEDNLSWRKARHPDLRRLPSAGSIFKKVEGIGAGRLIDECGLKGRISGRAQIYEGHANIIVNLGGALARDVLELMELAQSTVFAQTGHTLTPEITLLGEF